MKARRILWIASLLIVVFLAITSMSEAGGKRQPIIDDESICLDIPLGRGEEAERLTYTSPCIHKHWEGVILPIDGQPGDIRLQNVTLEASPGFSSCMVRHFTIYSTATFTLENSSEVSVTAFTLAFPFSTHALYGDHNTFRDFQIRVDGAPIAFETAMDHAFYEIRDPGEELYYKGREINGWVHPLISDTIDIRALSSFLPEQGFDMLAYWQMDFGPREQRVVQIEYTSNSNDFSNCCHEVWGASGTAPYYFYFDLSNAGYWQHPTDVHILLHDTASAIWSAVPQLDLERTCAETGIEFRGKDVLLTQDLAIPAEPDVFGIRPRCWPSDEILPQSFTLEWIDNSYYYTRTRVYTITATGGVTIENVELPLYLSEISPTASFSVTLAPDQLSNPAYFDVYGAGSNGYEYLHQAFVRVPITGHTVTGHDLAITSLGISSAILDATRMMTVTAVVENRGAFDESSVLASLYVNQNYVTNAVFPGLNSGENQEIVIGWDASFTAFYLVEVEIEPVPGEVERHNNAARISTTVAVDAIYLPIVLKS